MASGLTKNGYLKVKHKWKGSVKIDILLFSSVGKADLIGFFS